MKKTFLFAFALVASVLAFVACDKKDKQKDEPAVSSPIAGTWFASEGSNDYFYTFNTDGSYQRIKDYYMYGRAVVAHEHIVADGSYQIENDIVTVKSTPSVFLWTEVPLVLSPISGLRKRK